MEKFEELLQKISEEQIRHGEQIKTLFKQQEELKKLTDSVWKLSGSVEKLTDSLQATDKKVDKLAENIDELKDKPAKKWDTVVTVALTAIVSALITFVITKFGIG